MNTNCHCGGRLSRTDIKLTSDPNTKRVLYVDTDPLVAHWRCDRCWRVTEQRKRLPRAHKRLESQPIWE